MSFGMLSVVTVHARCDPCRNREFQFGLAELGTSNKAKGGGGEGGGGGRDEERSGKKSDHTPLISPTTPTSPGGNKTPPTTTTTTTSKAVQIESTGTGGYSAVNMLSILPDDVRTEENLEGGSLPEDQAQKLISDYNRQRKEYEERELQKQAVAAATGSSPSKVDLATKKQPHGGKVTNPGQTSSEEQQASAVRALKFTPGYEDMDDPPPAPGYDKVVLLSKSAPMSRKRFDNGEYEDPADAVPSELAAARSHLRGTKGNVVVPKAQVTPNKPKSFQPTTSGDGKYTAVYNPGEGETIGQQAVSMKRAMSDSSPSHRLVNGSHSSPGKQPHHYTNTVGGTEGGNSSSGGSLDDMSKGFDRKEPMRGSKHKSAKEEVEFDPTSKKVFRVTSTKKKRTANGRDLPDGGGEESNGDSSPDSKMHAKEKQFDLYGDGDFGGGEYSMVNVADKKMYRTEDDVMKKEGSGTPQRYSAKSPLKQEVA